MDSTDKEFVGNVAGALAEGLDNLRETMEQTDIRVEALDERLTAIYSKLDNIYDWLYYRKWED